MPSGHVESSVAHPELASDFDGVGGLSDEELIERFLHSGRDQAEAAFRLLVVRHGPMVLGVCRHVLNQHQDAEDAFQATFIALARKAGSIKDRRVLARWLYEVAYRIAVRAKTSAVRKRMRERQGAEMSAYGGPQRSRVERTPTGAPRRAEPLARQVPHAGCALLPRRQDQRGGRRAAPLAGENGQGRLSRASRTPAISARQTRFAPSRRHSWSHRSSQNAVFAEVVPLRLIDATVDHAVLRWRTRHPYLIRWESTSTHRAPMPWVRRSS